MPPLRIEFCGALMFSEFEKAAKDDGSERLIPCFSRGCLDRMLYVQLRRSKGNIREAVSKVVSSLGRIEAAVKALHEHERLMDKDFFEMLVKADSFLVSGREKETGNPLFWHRYDVPHIDAWKIRRDSPKAHALIRHLVYVYQLGYARVISEGLYETDHQQRPLIVSDCVCSLKIARR